MQMRLTKKSFEIIVCTLVVLLIATWEVSKFSYIRENDILSYTLFYLKPVLALTMLYLSIYAYMSKLKFKRKLESPILFIIIGLMFTFLSIAPSFFGYYMSIKLDFTKISSSRLEQTKLLATDSSASFESREFAAKIYFEETGKPIKLLTPQGSRSTYKPSEKALKGREDNVLIKKRIERTKELALKNCINLIALFCISLAGFLVFIRYKKNGSGNNIQTVST